jgi:hypothetical protein
MAAKRRKATSELKRWVPRNDPSRIAAMRWHTAFAERGLRAKEVAKLLGVSPGTLSAVMAGVDTSAPLMEKLEKLIADTPTVS